MMGDASTERQQLVESLRRKRAWMNDYTTVTENQWRESQKPRIERMRRELGFELTMAARAAALSENERRVHERDVVEGVHELETTLRRLGLGEGAEVAIDAEAYASEMQQRIRDETRARRERATQQRVRGA